MAVEGQGPGLILGAEVEINDSHPLAQGLVYLHVGNRELVSGAALIPVHVNASAQAWIASPTRKGPAVLTPNSPSTTVAAGFWTPKHAAWGRITTGVSFYINGIPRAAAQWAQFLTLPASTGWGAPWFGIGFGYDNTGLGRIGWQTAAFSTSAYQSASGFYDVDVLGSYVATRDAGTVRFYKNGAQHGSTQTGGNTSALYNAAASMGDPVMYERQRTEGSGGEVMGAAIGVHAVWNRELSAAEVASLDGDWTQLVRPKIPALLLLNPDPPGVTQAPSVSLAVPTPSVTGEINVTTTAPGVAMTIANGGVTRPDVSYDYDNSRTVNSALGGDRRTVDITIPWGTKPAAGYPVVGWLHGGSFVTGDEDFIATGQLQHALDHGHVFAAISYALATDVDGYWNLPTHPMPRQDVGVCLQYLVDDWDIDEDGIVLTGYSAGAHIALEYLLTHDDTRNYTRAYDGPSGGRVNAEPETGTTFDFDQNHGVQPKPKALFLWAGPLDLTVALASNSLLANALRGYMGGDSREAFVLSATNHEQDLNYLAAGTTGTPYAGYTHYTELAGVPIGYVEARWGAAGYSVPSPPAIDSAEETVVPSSGIEVLKTVMTDAGIPNTPNSSTVNGLNLSGGLSHFRHRVYVGSFGSFPHDTVYAADNFTAITRVSDGVAADYHNWFEWLLDSAFTTTTAPSATLSVPTPGASAGGTNGSITTTAPAATFFRSATASVSDGVTTTAPTVALTPVAFVWNLYGSGVYGSSAYATSSDRLVTTTAPGATLSAAATASVSDGVTTTAPSVAVSAAATASVSDGITTTAPQAAFTANATAASFAPGSITTTAPGATFTSSATASVSDGVTTTAPSVGLTAAATASGATAGSVTTSAAAAAFGVGTVMVTVSAGFQITAPAAALLTAATASTGTAVTTTAPSAGFTANNVSLSQAGAVTTTAPRVLVGVGASTPLYVFNSRRVPGIRRPDWTHTSRRPDSGHTTPRP